MRGLSNLIWIIFILLFYRCQYVDDAEVFNGDIVFVEDSVEKIQDVTIKKLFLDGNNYGYASAYDSLLLFMNPKLGSHFFQIFNVNTGKELGQFVRKGLGPDEIIAAGPIWQLYKENEELKTLVFAPNEEKVWIWNISQSLEQQKTVVDTIYSCLWKEKGICYKEMFKIDDTFLMKVPAFPIGEDDATLPFYLQCETGTQTPLREFAIYKKSIKNSDSEVMPEMFYYSNDALKPDGTKIVQAMTKMPQLNILDLRSGKVIGYRLEGGDDFSIFQTENSLKTYFVRVQADDDFIYAVYWGKDLWKRNEIPYLNTIYVFTWEGRLVKKIRTDGDIDNISVDNVGKRLYLTRPKQDEVYYLDLSNI